MKAPSGTFRHRFILERNETLPDGTGGFTSAWVPVRRLWGRLLSAGLQSVWQGQRPAMERRSTIIARWREDVLPGMRLRLGPRIFTVRTVRDDDGMRRLLVCDCEEFQ